MTDENRTAILFSLLRSAMTGEMLLPEERDVLSADTLPAVYTMAKRHDVAHLMALGLKNNGLLPPDHPAMGKEIIKAFYRCEQITYALTEVCQTFEKAEIAFMPLKGSVIRPYYPESWMRTSCDVDILVHESDLDRALSALSTHLGYITDGEKGSHDVSLYTPSQMHVELHYDLVEDRHANQAARILTDVWNTAVPKEGHRYHHEMPDDLFYFYHIAHMAKHFENGGCGIRPFVDLWVLDHIASADPDGRDALLHQGNLFRFAEVARALSRVWMEGSDHTELTEQVENYILRGGVYGTTENRVIFQQQKKGGRVKYALSRIFLPYDVIKFAYPILQKHRFLTPVMEVRRWFRLLFGGGAKRAMRELKFNNQVTQTEAEQTRMFLDKIGL